MEKGVELVANMKQVQVHQLLAKCGWWEIGDGLPVMSPDAIESGRYDERFCPGRWRHRYGRKWEFRQSTMHSSRGTVRASDVWVCDLTFSSTVPVQ